MSSLALCQRKAISAHWHHWRPCLPSIPSRRPVKSHCCAPGRESRLAASLQHSQLPKDRKFKLPKDLEFLVMDTGNWSLRGGEQLAGPGAKQSRNRRFDCNWDFPELPISKDLIGKPKGVKRVPQERGLWRDALKRQCNRQKKDSCSGKKQETGSWALRLVSMFLKRLWIAEVLHPSHSATTRRSNSEQEMMTHSTIAIR